MADAESASGNLVDPDSYSPARSLVTPDCVVTAVLNMKSDDQIEVMIRLRATLKRDVLRKAGIKAKQKPIKERVAHNLKKLGIRNRAGGSSPSSADPREELFQYLIDRHWDGRDEDSDGWNVLPSETELIALERVPADTVEMYEKWAYVQDGASKITDVPKDEMRQLMYEVGVLAKHRYSLWKAWLGPLTKVDYIGLCDEAPNEVPTVIKKQIEVDLPRTLPKVLKKEHESALRRVLQSYAFYNQDVGYCQSMNVIVGVLLYLGFEEEEVFSMLCRVLGERLCYGYHHPSLATLMVDMAVCERLISEVVPLALTNIETCGLDVLFFAVDPFLCLFAHTLPLTSLFRVWDVVFFEGIAGLFAVFMAFLKLNFMSGVFASSNADEVISNWNAGVRRLAVVRLNHVLNVAKSLIDSNIITLARIKELRLVVAADKDGAGDTDKAVARSPGESEWSDSSSQKVKSRRNSGSGFMAVLTRKKKKSK